MILLNVLHFDHANIKNISSEDDYPSELKSGNITAAFPELPYSKAFMNQFCEGYTVATLPDGVVHRFGGFGFVSSNCGLGMVLEYVWLIFCYVHNGKEADAGA
ncbi:unnamed protein product [Ilex paraguariensis]|uniref:Uncharacterized protein n=1 Tax=Ilex paraguariensis TaxID=185542 RepID=A0ABC8RT61_9AQUA